MTTPEENARLLRLATVWSVATAGVLIVVKLVVWLTTGSVALLASLLDSLMDAAASVVNLLAVRYSLQPADEEHRFGHGKAESLAGLAQSAFIAGTAVLLLFEAVDRLLHPQPVQGIAQGIGVMIFATVATLVLIGVQRYVIRRTGSLAIRADSFHYAMDLFTNMAVILALGLAAWGVSWADPVFGLGLGVVILAGAYGIGREAVDHLMDRELGEDAQQEIASIALDHEQVRAVHELRTRQAGQTRFIQMHLELDGSMTLARAHDIGDEVADRIRAGFPGADVLIHQDPGDDSMPDMPGERITGPAGLE
ncbi:MAG: cation diffusion facilitator family transporter [Gammaproteobacteria bacterium]